MHSDEIESWYQREKERLTDEFTLKLRQSQNKNIPKVHAEYEPKFRQLVAKYNALHNNRINEEDREKRVEEKKKSVKKFFEGIKKKVQEKIGSKE
jgi:hypothetical protein